MAMGMPLTPGPFGSPRLNCVDCGQLVFGEVLKAFGHLVAWAAYDGQRGIAEGGEHLWGGPSVGPCLVFAAGDVADVMQTVLDPPMRPRQREQFVRSRLLSGQTGDRVDSLDGFLAAHDAFARDAADLRHTGPVRREEAVQRPGRLDLADLDPAVAFLDRFGVARVSRWGPRG